MKSNPAKFIFSRVVKVTKMTLLLLNLILLIGNSLAFEIISSSGDTYAIDGQPVTLTCQSDYDHGYCSWIHDQGKESTDEDPYCEQLWIEELLITEKCIPRSFNVTFLSKNNLLFKRI